MSTKPAILVGTDGTPQRDRAVREAAHVARALSAPLHVVCCVPRLPAHEQRAIDRSLPGDLGHLAGPQGQRTAALEDVRRLIGDYCELRLSSSEHGVRRALLELSASVDGEIYGERRSRPRPGLPALGLRARATA